MGHLFHLPYWALLGIEFGGLRELTLRWAGTTLRLWPNLRIARLHHPEPIDRGVLPPPRDREVQPTRKGAGTPVQTPTHVKLCWR